MTTHGPYSLSAPFRFDIESAAFKTNPVPTFAEMRAAEPVIPIKFPILGRTWITTNDAVAVAQSFELMLELLGGLRPAGDHDQRRAGASLQIAKGHTVTGRDLAHGYARVVHRTTPFATR
jgi:hypothetical protein